MRPLKDKAWAKNPDLVQTFTKLYATHACSQHLYEFNNIYATP